MQINATKDGKTMTMTLKGVFDYVAAADFAEYTKDNFKGVWNLVLDMEGVEYISSAGMRVLLQSELTMKERGGMKIVRVNDVIRETFSMTGFDRFLVIE